MYDRIIESIKLTDIDIIPIIPVVRSLCFNDQISHRIYLWFRFQIAQRLEGMSLAESNERQMCQKVSHLKKTLYFLPNYP